MKDIIEKYKMRDLKLDEFFSAGYELVKGDSFISTDGRVLVVGLDSTVNTANQTDKDDSERFVATSLQLDKEIAAMEKQPEYDYVPIDIKDVNEDMLDTVFIDGNGEVSIRDASVAEFLCCVLYRRVEITPEQKREREVEELAMVMREKDIPGSSIGWCSVANSVKVTYRSMAKVAIEWMESK